MEEKVLVGKIIKPFGIKGEVKVDAMTDFPDERFKVGAIVYLREKRGDQSLVIASHRVHKGYDLISFEGMQDINLIEAFRMHELYALKDDSLLDEGEVWVSDLMGCEVYNHGTLFGVVKDMYDNTYQDLLVVEHNGKRVLIPYVDAFVKNKDIEHKRIDVALFKGFVDDED